MEPIDVAAGRAVFGAAGVGAPTADEAAELDRWAADERGVDEATLMECAGRSAAHVLQRLHPRGKVVAAVGPGNNGGDALVLVRTLAAWGRPVEVIRAADREGGGLLHGWSLDGLGDASEAPPTEEECLERFRGGEIVVDGILGTGATGAPRAPQAGVIRAMNDAGLPVVALDTPSGVDATTGRIPGEAVKADVTVAFGWPKRGTLLHPGRDRVGRLVAVEIGFPPLRPGAFEAELVTPGWAWTRRPLRDAETHKGAVGELLVVAGEPGVAGAAAMAGRAALRSGVGLLRIASAPENREILQTLVPEALFVDRDDADALAGAASTADALLAGPGVGVGEDGTRVLRAVLEASGGTPTVLDADALTLAAEGRVPGLGEVGASRPLLLTPHPGEMARITGRATGEIVADRVGAARGGAAGFGSALLLKGLPSVVALPGGGILLNTVGSSDLASGGMGDVLAGSAGAFLAQGAPPGEAGALALYYTGRAADRAGRGRGLTPRDVADGIPAALTEQGPGPDRLGLPFVTFDQPPAR